MSSSPSSEKVISADELAKHNTENSLWIAINGTVYDVTKFAKLHPGGKALLLKVAGTDASEHFYALHSKSVLVKYKKLAIGALEGADAKIAVADELVSNLPYAEAPFLRTGWVKSPFMNDSHEEYHKAVRDFVRTQIVPEAEAGEETGEYPSAELYQKMGEFGLLASRIGVAAMPHVKRLGIKLPANLNPDDFDPFHEMICQGEVGRMGFPGFSDGIGAGFCIGLPPIFHFAKKPIRERVVPEVLLGKKRICLAISEAHAGSDVANIITWANKSECGKFYIVNGVKKWITNGGFADYFVTAVRTGGKGLKGISMLFIPRGEGVTTKAIKTSYSPAAGTALVLFDNCKVPVENLMGKENEGFKCVMANFNHERWFICAYIQGSMRAIIEDCMKWAMQRRVFGHKLMDQPVIRQKFARMIAAVEANQGFLEMVTYQMKCMDYFTQTLQLAGPVALLKYNTTRTATLISDEACQIFGGRAITKTGMGRKVEMFQRTFKFGSILGGSEEIMADLGVRQSMAGFPKEARL